MMPGARSGLLSLAWECELGLKLVSTPPEPGLNETKVLVKLDFANAFNRISRQAVLDNATKHFPTISRGLPGATSVPATCGLAVARAGWSKETH